MLLFKVMILKIPTIIKQMKRLIFGQKMQQTGIPNKLLRVRVSLLYRITQRSFSKTIKNK
jgi:hypothetical protein